MLLMIISLFCIDVLIADCGFLKSTTGKPWLFKNVMKTSSGMLVFERTRVLFEVTQLLQLTVIESLLEPRDFRGR